MAGKLVNKARIRTPVVDGLFYPEEREVLKAQIRSWGLGGNTGRQAAAVIAPHGAWDLTGNIAGAAFAAAAGRRKGGSAVSRVIVMGPLPDRHYQGLYLSDSAFFQTPLGKLPVDLQFNEELESHSAVFETNDIPHLSEHSLEVLLPIIQFCFPRTAIVPILMGGSGRALIDGLAGALRLTLGNGMDNTLIVATANLSQNRDPAKALQQADLLIRLIDEGGSGEYLAALKKDELSACGAAVLAGLLHSGLLEGKTLAAGPRITGISEKGETIYYGALSFE
jgi:AmmeMemoRadiSam system protein B